MSAYYIGCDTPPSVSQFGTACPPTSTPVVLTEQQASDLLSPPMLTADEAWLYAGLIFTVSLLSWGFRLSIKQFNLGV